MVYDCISMVLLKIVGKKPVQLFSSAGSVSFSLLVHWFALKMG